MKQQDSDAELQREIALLKAIFDPMNYRKNLADKLRSHGMQIVRRERKRGPYTKKDDLAA